MSASIYDIPVHKITGEDARSPNSKAKFLLVVNVASKCGLTPQYEGLESLYEQFRGQGLVVAGFPANNFKSQEPGTNDEIQSFCTTNFGVKFPMFSKISVAGDDKHPLYQALIDCATQSDQRGGGPVSREAEGIRDRDQCGARVLWNFEKFLVSRKGEVVKRFSPDTLPDAPELIAAIKEELAKE